MQSIFELEFVHKNINPAPLSHTYTNNISNKELSKEGL